MICQLCLYSKVHHIFKNTADVVVSENKCHNFVDNTLKNVKFNASTKVIISSIIFLSKRKQDVQMDYFNKLKLIAENNGGIINNKIAPEHSISRAILSKLCLDNKL